MPTNKSLFTLAITVISSGSLYAMGQGPMEVDTHQTTNSTATIFPTLQTLSAAQAAQRIFFGKNEDEFNNLAPQQQNLVRPKLDLLAQKMAQKL